jgi:hypothetical protein
MDSYNLADSKAAASSPPPPLHQSQATIEFEQFRNITLTIFMCMMLSRLFHGALSGKVIRLRSLSPRASKLTHARRPRSLRHNQMMPSKKAHSLRSFQIQTSGIFRLTSGQIGRHRCE